MNDSLTRFLGNQGLCATLAHNFTTLQSASTADCAVIWRISIDRIGDLKCLSCFLPPERCARLHLPYSGSLGLHFPAFPNAQD